MRYTGMLSKPRAGRGTLQVQTEQLPRHVPAGTQGLDVLPQRVATIEQDSYLIM